jgi:hypothetical protein
MKDKIYYLFYSNIMRIAHRFNWHYAPPIRPDRDTQLWCKWCGFRETIARAEKPTVSGLATLERESRPLPPEIAKALNEDFWKLI